MNKLGIIYLNTGARNSQVNAALERIHQALGNCLRMVDLGDVELDEHHPWDEVLAAANKKYSAHYFGRLTSTTRIWNGHNITDTD